MNIVKSYQERRLLGCRQNAFNVDFVVERFSCKEDEEYPCLTPNLNRNDVNPEPPIYACAFCTSIQHSNILALANEDGKLALQDTGKINEKEPLEGFQAHCNAIYDIAWLEQKMQLLSVSGDHSVILWDVTRDGSFSQLSVFKGHTQSIKTLSIKHKDNCVFATGSRDGTVRIWDTRSKNPETNQIKNAHCIHNLVDGMSPKGRKHVGHTSVSSSVTCVRFQDDYNLMSTGERDGIIKVWDIRKNYLNYKKDPVPACILQHPGTTARKSAPCFTDLVIGTDMTSLFASCKDNVIYRFDLASFLPKPVAAYTGFENRSFFVKMSVSPDGRYLLSGSSDEAAYIWNIQRPGPPLVKLTGHRAEVTAVAWNPSDFEKIVTCSDDVRHRVWRVRYPTDNVESDKLTLCGWTEKCIVSDSSNNKENIESVSDIPPSKIPRTPSCAKAKATQGLKTPSSSRSSRGRLDVTPRTPQSSSPNLLSWLSSPAEKKDAKKGLKRRLADSLDVNLENKSGANTTASPPSKPLQSAVKHKLCSGSSNQTKYLKREPLDVVEKCLSVPCSSGVLDNTENLSPTVNLPNYVIDGRSPHTPQSSAKKRKSSTNWLTDFANKRKLKFSPAPASQAVKHSEEMKGLTASPSSSKKRTLLNYFMRGDGH